MTANERFKKSYGNRMWGGVIIATLAHFSFFFFFPELTAEDVSFSADELEAIELPPHIEIPPPPEAIARPATPVIATADIDEDITIAPTTFDENPVEDLPPPPSEVAQTDLSAAPTFTPFTVRPDIRNRNDVARALEREYPLSSGMRELVERCRPGSSSTRKALSRTPSSTSRPVIRRWTRRPCGWRTSSSSPRR